MPLFENCKSKTVKCKSGNYNEDPFIVNSKGKEKKYMGEISSSGRGVWKEKKEIDNCKKKKEIFSKTGDIEENKFMLFK